jgi:parvulin-like peptidyl-prolyl isomerase
MTLRVRRPRRGIRTRLGRFFEGEERQQTVVTTLFIAAIAATVLILIGAIALAWYNDNLRPLARVGSVEVGPQQLRELVGLERWRIAREEGRVTEARISQEIDEQSAQARLTELDQRGDSLPSTALDELIDAIYQSQLAVEEGVTVTDADIDARIQEDLAGVERRRIQLIAVEPLAANAEEGPTLVERRTALERAQEALTRVQGGDDWATVAREFSTDVTAPAGGELGLRSQLAVSDTELGRALFELEESGTTGVVRGNDGIYRIGRVTEIVEATEEPGARADLLASVPESGLRTLVGYQVAADRLSDKIVGDALAATPEQVRIAVIFIEGLLSDDPNDPDTLGGEIDYSEIVFAPNDDLVDAPDLPADDPAWAAAKTEADNTFAELQGLTDPDIRATRFETLATDNSDSPTADDGGRVGFVTRSIPPIAVGDALYDTPHVEGDLIGPVKGDAAWYVLLFHEKRESPESRIQAVKDALAAPGADFNEVARELSEGPEADDGGEVGWLTRDQLTDELAEDVYALEVGAVSEPLELGEGHYFVKLEEKGVRPLDPDQIPNIRSTAFSDWYDPKKEAAEANGTIVRADGTTTAEPEIPELEPEGP